MENNLIVIGDENLVLFYNLNKQYLNIKKLIITYKELFANVENFNLEEFLVDFKNNKSLTFEEFCIKKNKSFDFDLNNDLYKKINDSLNKISSNYMDVELKDFNFMNSVSNSKYTIVLRCLGFSFSSYYVEKGAIFKNIKDLIRKYINFNGNFYRLDKLVNFQIEIFESEEIQKRFYLKKDENKFILSSFFGFSKSFPFDNQIGSEFYICEDNNFEFFANKQTNAVVREYNKLTFKEIDVLDKVLSNQDLILINDNTKNIHDVIIEGYINSKNQLKIIDVCLFDNKITNYSKNGFVINKSINNFDRICVFGIRDNFEEETLNPKYLFLKNEQDLKEFLEDFKIFSKVDGLILNYNFYSPLIDYLGFKENKDILFFNKQIKRNLDEKINWASFDLENSCEILNNSNPFSKIIKDEDKNRDEVLEKLKNIDLSTPKEDNFQNGQREVVESQVNSIIGSSNSSFNKSSFNESINSNSSNLKEKKSAIGMLIDSAKDLEIRKNQQNFKQELDNQKTVSKDDFSYENKNENIIKDEKVKESNFNNLNFNNLENFKENLSFENQRKDLEQNFSNQNNLSLESNSIKDKNLENFSKKEENKIDFLRYEKVLKTNILSSPSFNLDGFFVDSSNVLDISNFKRTFFLVNSYKDMTNPSLDYVLPINLFENNDKNCFYLINSVFDFFLINKEQSLNYFVNICEIDNLIKESFLKNISSFCDSFSLICNKSDLDFVKDFINFVDNIYIRDLEENDVEFVKNKILSFEKSFLFNLVNKNKNI